MAFNDTPRPAPLNVPANRTQALANIALMKARLGKRRTRLAECVDQTEARGC